jgi:hypothetical protein
MSDNTTLASLDAAVGELLDAVGAEESISKAYGGVSIDQGGHVDERGKTGGGYAGGGDVGGIDKMMIAKMGESLLDAGFPVEQVVALMSGKDDDKPDFLQGKMKEDEEDEEDEDEEDEAEKSEIAYDLAKGYVEDPGMVDAIDASPFLRGLVEVTTDHMADLHKSVRDAQTGQAGVNRALAIALAEVGQLVKSQAAVIQHLGQRLGVVESTPVAPRGARTVPQARAMQKSIAGVSEQAEQLTKSELASTLTYMNLEKGIREIGGRSTSELASFAESGAVDRRALTAAQRFLRTHPGEASTARSYR